MAQVGIQTFRAFRQRNFRLFFVGQVLSVSGTWAQRVAQAWLAYRLTHSALFLGYVTFASSAPAFLFTPIAGLLADRVERRSMLVWAQTFAMFQAAVLAAATLTGAITPNLLLLLSLVLGIINAVENPTRQSFYSEMVEPEDMSNAIALNASLVNAARVIGPAIAGGLVASWGEGVCFFINAISFLAVIVALLMMKIKPLPRAARRANNWQFLREGFVFVRATPMLGAMLLNFGIFNFAGSPYQTLLPVLAAERLFSGPAGLGWLVSASGVGAIVSSLFLASRPNTEGLTSASFIASGLAGVALIVLGFSRSFPLSILMMLIIGGGYSITLAATQTMMQTWVHEAMRGRVMSFYSLVFLGVPPIGSLIAGIAAARFHTTGTLAVGGLLCVVGAIYCARGKATKARPALVS